MVKLEEVFLCDCQVLARRLRLEGTFDFAAVAAKTPGYVGADLAALTKEAGAVAIARVFSSIRPATMVSSQITSGGGPAKCIACIVLRC